MDSPPRVVSRAGYIYTFYSYKGGVGRSMALVNVGVLMALAGHRVLLVDWDLEAPGLEVYFRGYGKCSQPPESAPGIVDLLEGRATGKETSWANCVNTVTFQGGKIDLISAGKRSEDYRNRVQNLNWTSLYSEHKIGNYVNYLRDEWRREYDFILIDSRTGVTDIGDVCTVLLPDVLVLMFVTNFQNIEGIRNIMKRAIAARKDLPIDFSKLLGLPLPARIEPSSEYKGWGEWSERFATQFDDYYREWLPKELDPRDVINKLYIPYVTNWSFGEKIPVLENARELQDYASIGMAYSRVATLLMNQLNWYSLESRSTADELQGTRIALQRARIEVDSSVRELGRTKTISGAKIGLSILVGVTAILGLLAVFAIPKYRDYELKGQIADAINQATPAKVAVAVYYSANGALPNSNDEIGLPVASGSSIGNETVDVQEDGKIQIGFAPGVHGIGGKTIALTPLSGRAGEIIWKCSSDDIDQSYLPNQCLINGETIHPVAPSGDLSGSPRVEPSAGGDGLPQSVPDDKDRNSKYSVRVFYNTSRKDDAQKLLFALSQAGFMASVVPTSLEEEIKYFGRLSSGTTLIMRKEKGPSQAVQEDVHQIVLKSLSPRLSRDCPTGQGSPAIGGCVSSLDAFPILRGDIQVQLY